MLKQLDGIRQELAKLTTGSIEEGVSLQKLTRWKIGGPVDFLVRPQTSEEVGQLIRYLNREQVPWMTMGYSSNLLFCDEGIRGVIIVIAENLSKFERRGEEVLVQAGHWVPGLARRLMVCGLAGAEHIVGIPGTIGGLICMNGGSMRKGIGANVVQVKCYDRNGQPVELSHSECKFEYRRSEIQQQSLTVTNATLRFTPSSPAEIRSQMRDILRSRRLKFPLKDPNCGSVFVSDPSMYERFGPPGAVIEKCGLKGARIGDAQVSNNHANFIVNRGEASAVDVIRLIHRIRNRASEQLDCDLHCEVRHVAKDCTIRPAHEVELEPSQE